MFDVLKCYSSKSVQSFDVTFDVRAAFTKFDVEVIPQIFILT